MDAGDAAFRRWLLPFSMYFAFEAFAIFFRWLSMLTATPTLLSDDHIFATYFLSPAACFSMSFFRHLRQIESPLLSLSLIDIAAFDTDFRQAFWFFILRFDAATITPFRRRFIDAAFSLFPFPKLHAERYAFEATRCLSILADFSP